MREADRGHGAGAARRGWTSSSGAAGPTASGLGARARRRTSSRTSAARGAALAGHGRRRRRGGAPALADDVRALGGEIRLSTASPTTGRAVSPWRFRRQRHARLGRRSCAPGRGRTCWRRRRDVRVLPFRGAYRVLRRPELVRALVYPVPDPSLPCLGVHLPAASTTRSTSGRPRCWRARGTPTACAGARRRPRARLAGHLPDGAAQVADGRDRGRPRRLPARRSPRAAAAFSASCAPTTRARARLASAARPSPATGRCSTTSCIAGGRRACTSATRPSPAATACLASPEVIAVRAERYRTWSSPPPPKKDPGHRHHRLRRLRAGARTARRGPRGARLHA